MLPPPPPEPEEDKPLPLPLPKPEPEPEPPKPKPKGPEEDKPLPLPLPEPEPEPPKPKPKGPEPTMPKPAGPLPERDGATSPPDILCGDTCSGPCVYLPHCQPPPPLSSGATVHLRSGRLPTPLIALSASLLAVSAVLLLALLVHRLVRRRRRRRRLAQDAALAAAQHGEEGGGGHHQVLAAAVEQEVAGEDGADGGGVHHVWYIRTKGLDERAIAAIAAVVYDAKKRGAIGLRGGGGGTDGGDDGDDDGSCAVCLAEFRDGETLRLLPRCGHAFHRGCIDTWLRAHVNCPLCRAPVEVTALAASAGAINPNAAAPAAPMATSGRRQERNPVGAVGGVQTEEAARGGGGGGGVPDRAVRRAASMVALPRRAWPDVSLLAPASSSGREEDMTGLGKIRRLLKFSDALEMAGIGVERSVSFGAGSWQRLPPRSGPSAAAAGVSADEMAQ